MLELINIGCGYGAFNAVHELSLTVTAGQTSALIGANGAGKTSTIMTIAGHVEQKGGQVLFDGDDISKLDPRERVKRGIAVVPEGRRLFPDLTVTENLIVGGYSLPIARQTINQKRVYSLFPRLATRANQRADTLSGGEQQMLAMGRALMAQPKLLLVDELSLGLMPKMIDVCYGALGVLQAEGVGILLVEQNTQRVLEFAREIWVLESGRVAWQGNTEDAKQDPALIEAYMGIRTNTVA